MPNRSERITLAPAREQSHTDHRHDPYDLDALIMVSAKAELFLAYVC
jgi:hypothetical protein